MKSPFSTREVAKIVGVSRGTLERWLLSGKLRRPRQIGFAGVEVMVWSATDLDRARRFKAANYRKGRGRKKRAA